MHSFKKVCQHCSEMDLLKGITGRNATEFALDEIL